VNGRRILAFVAAATSALIVILPLSAATASQEGRVTGGAIYALTSRGPDGSLVLSRLDPRLSAGGPALALGGAADGASAVRAFSPDGSELALASDAVEGDRTLLTFIDLTQMRIRGRVPVPGNLSEIVWLAPKRLLAFVAADPARPRPDYLPLHVVDSEGHRLVRTRMVPALGVLRITPRWVVGLFTPAGKGTTQIARIDANADIRKADTGIGGGAAFVEHESTHYSVIRQPALAIAPNGEEAFVLGSGEPAAHVDLRILSISHHELRPPLPRIDKVETSSMTAVSLSERLVAVTGGTATFPLDPRVAPRERSLGLRLLDTETWESKTLDSSVDTVPVAVNNTLIVIYSGHVVGFNPNGTRRFIARDKRLDPNGAAFGCGQYFYFQADNLREMRRGAPALAFDALIGREVGETDFRGSDLVWLDSPCNTTG
jgi:hypothetical protein